MMKFCVTEELPLLSLEVCLKTHPPLIKFNTQGTRDAQSSFLEVHCRRRFDNGCSKEHLRRSFPKSWLSSKSHGQSGPRAKELLACTFSLILRAISSITDTLLPRRNHCSANVV